VHQLQFGLLTLAGALACLTIQPASAEPESTGTEGLAQSSEINRIRDRNETSATAITAIPRVKDRQRAVKQQPPTAVNEAPVKPTPLPTNQPDAVPQYPQGVKPASQSTPVPPPVEPADLPPPPKLAPAIIEPPPAPVEAPPLPSEPAPVDVAPPAPTSGNSAP
jgi:hypothetical protein